MGFAVALSASAQQTEESPKEVDLGLSVNWSTDYLDVAEKPTDYSSEYLWASPYSRLNYNDYREYAPADMNVGLNIASTNFDAATAGLGEGWRLPTKAECEELMKLGVKYVIRDDGKKGFEVKGENGNVLFFEHRSNSSVVGLYTEFWTADAYRESDESTDYSKAWSCRISIAKDMELLASEREKIVMAIRPVRDSKSEKVSVGALTLSATELTIDKGFENTLYAFTSPDNATYRWVNYASSAPEVVSVDGFGHLKALAEGSATITVTAADGSGVSATCTVNVPSLSETSEVDLGLSVLWASHNVGADDIKAIGNYFQFANPAILSKWSITSSPYTDTRQLPVTDVAGTQYDPATVNMGEAWKTPTKEQFEELFANCDKTDVEGGFELVSRINGAKIFLPAVGYKYVSATNAKSDGYYQTAVSPTNDVVSGSYPCAKLTNNMLCGFEDRKLTQGVVVRAVKAKGGSAIDSVIADGDGLMDVYNICGVKVLGGVERTALSTLRPGVYIIRTTSGRVYKVKI